MRLPAFLAFAALLAAASASAAPAVSTATAPAKAPLWKEGVNYQPVLPAQPTDVKPGQIEVLEFFWYACPSCFQLEPYLEIWDRSKPTNVILKRVPGIVRPEAEAGARAYYVAESLGLLDKAHEALFNAIHIKHAMAGTAEADYEQFFIANLGVTAKQFENAWDSPAVSAKGGVPTLVVNGKWLTGGGYNLAYSQIMQVVNYLIQTEEAAQPASAK
jgi:thiol:disulfide interchange protein DsbA